jgi:putative chitinase
MAAALDRAKFFSAVRIKPFGGTLNAAQVSGIEAKLDACPPDFPRWWLAYCLATDFHETGRTMLPVREKGGNAYLSKYDTGKLAAALGNTPEADGDGIKYAGAGDVQLTGARNFGKATTRLQALGYLSKSQSLLDNPELALDPHISAAVLFIGCAEGWFTGKKLGDYLKGAMPDPVNARRVVNGTDEADLIAGYFWSFDAALKLAGYVPSGLASTIPVPPVSVAPVPPVAPSVKPVPPIGKPVSLPPPQVLPPPTVVATPNLLARVLARLRAKYPFEG